jgi:fumarylpyruvate hydrolase
MNYAFPPEAPVTLPISGEDTVFPVRRIYCVGRNYADHALEMGADPVQQPPFFFTKPRDAVVQSGAELDFPPATGELHHEVELVVALKGGGRDIPAASALDRVYGYAVGLDMTRRDLQAEAKEAGRPWDLAKGFDESAPISEIHPVSDVGHPDRGGITLWLNGELRQRGDLHDQIWQVADTIAYLSKFVELRAGDLIMTGTPAGVGAVQPGDRLEGRIDGLGEVRVRYRE